MKFEELAKTQYQDIDNLSVLLKNYVDVYRLLIAGASELYSVNLAEKGEVRKALERVEEIGELIDKLLATLERCENSYLNYNKKRAKPKPHPLHFANALLINFHLKWHSG